jgi:hypothetical protein
MRNLAASGRFVPASDGARPQGQRALVVKVRYLPHGQFQQFWAELSVNFVGVLPAPLTYGWNIEFSVTQGAKTRSYRYEVVNRAFIWLPLLPFSWISLLTPDEDDAYQMVVRRFIAESTADHVW